MDPRAPSSTRDTSEGDQRPLTRPALLAKRGKISHLSGDPDPSGNASLSGWPSGSSSPFVTKGEGTLISAHRTPRATDARANDRQARAGRLAREAAGRCSDRRSSLHSEPPGAGPVSTTTLAATSDPGAGLEAGTQDGRPGPVQGAGPEPHDSQGLGWLRLGEKKGPDHNLWPGPRRNTLDRICEQIRPAQILPNSYSHNWRGPASILNLENVQKL